MTIELQVDRGVPLLDDEPFCDLRVRVAAACETVNYLAAVDDSAHPHLETKASAADADLAVELAREYAENPEKASKKVSRKRIAKMTPASLVLTNSILEEFGTSVAESATQIRHLVTNKLILEADNPDAKVRLRALELLGKISDVGLFAEKSEVTITHQSTDDLRANLRKKLEKLVKEVEPDLLPNNVEDVEWVNPQEQEPVAVEFEGTVIDVEAEMYGEPE
jgi:hypothetical protein